ncbi:aminotransferase class I/II-fold pyridoxal phosphate-dependent enzyme [Sulfolobus acidocaldarius]|uniref:Aminotransferase n=4 Tax=Sulfolobus acidocaldarius TaxID=2285 RepID=Q4JBG4_SULAC|nr:aminotransferase class I/II-fold pyridoxal phosphate-dependent enzyme [Sulfolobus acidocaldarius]AAY79865.1 aminotransferase [Sulfolobus acidocaldarius DSM 639]AGE70427.1 aminotransferase [Sulfolobus acidocaldarius N8]AGE72701.1 aminotransferase [Sulfolobus acidocaldarius Ron12/I]ALU29187.1 aspartate aminotransferase [Sulfolobus acidocaldarius]ALU31914.1 aspartate aminotransferase [Sulfolobus acidocaldarius]
MRHGGVEWVHGRPLKIDDFSVNLNPLGTPEFIDELIRDALMNKVYSYYPPLQLRDIKEFIADLYNVDISLVGIFNGASEVISLLEPCNVPEPNYSEYKRAGSYYAMESDDIFIYSLEGSCVITSNPVNPTGSFVEREKIIDFLSNGGKLILDESFADISLIEPNYDLASEFDNLLFISSFTKSLAIPGLRIGFTIGKRSKELEDKSPPWRLNSIAYYVFSNLHAKEVRDFFRKSKDHLSSLISGLSSPFKIYKTVAPFVLVKFPIPATRVNQMLRPLGYQIRDSEGFKGLNEFYGRVAVKHNTNVLFKKIYDLVSIQ